MTEYRLPNKKPFLERPPFGAVGNSDQGPVDRLFDRTMLRERDRHIGGREKALRYLKNSGVALGDEVLQRADAVDDRVRFAARQRVESFRQVFIFRVLKMQFVEIFRA